MHESRAQRSVGLSLLTRQTGSIAPDHPPKQMHAWVCINIHSIYSDRKTVKTVREYISLRYISEMHYRFELI